MAEDEKFISRWSRLKREALAAPATAPGEVSAATALPADLPALDSLGFDSDFTGFLRAKVDEKLRQTALKKLFHSPHFNQMDGLDVYIDDYNKFEPIPPEMLRELNHAKDLLFSEKDRQADPPAADDGATSYAGEPATESAAITGTDAADATDATDKAAKPVPNSTPESSS